MANLALLGGKPYGTPDVPRWGYKWPVYDERELKMAEEIVRSGEWGTGGPKQVEFEETFAKYCGAEYGIFMTNGTHTLKLALEAMNIGPGDEVIVPGSTWQATASSVLDVNAIPVLTDVDPNTWCIDPKEIEKNITSRTKCIIPVHLYGRICDMDAIMALAKKYNLKVIEDCAHMHGGEWRGQKVGTIGNVGSFSLQKSKLLQTGEGGIDITNDKDLYDRIYSLKFCGRPRDPKDTTLPTMQSGNFRTSEFAAGMGLCQLQRLDEQNAKRAENAIYLEDALQAEIPGLTHLYRDPRVTLQGYYRLSMKYNKEAWDGVPRTAISRAFFAETEGAFKWVLPYEPLNNSALYRPFSKKTHKLSDEYCKAIDPARFPLPVIEKMYKEEYLGLDHMELLGEKSEMDKIVDIFKKLYNNRGELLEYAKAEGLK